MKLVICLVTFLTLSIAVSHVRAQTVGNSQKGLAVAQQVCAQCHAVERGEYRSLNARAPTFTELAAAPGMTDTALSVALMTPHAGMPMFTFTADERQDVIAYILSLR